MLEYIRKIYTGLFPYETRLKFYKLRHPREFEEVRTKVHPSPKGDFSLKPYDEYRCLFIHVTKTAGTSVARSLFGYLPYHYTAVDYRVIYGEKLFNEYFKFAFVRNPWDRLYSSYRYLMAGGWNEQDQQWTQQHIAHYKDFNDFVKNWLTDENIQKHVHFWPQSQFTCDHKGRLLLDYVGRFETLQTDFAYICQRLNIDATLKSLNRNPGQQYQEVYDPEAHAVAARIYARDIALFDYDKNH